MVKALYLVGVMSGKARDADTVKWQQVEESEEAVANCNDLEVSCDVASR